MYQINFMLYHLKFCCQHAVRLNASLPLLAPHSQFILLISYWQINQIYQIASICFMLFAVFELSVLIIVCMLHLTCCVLVYIRLTLKMCLIIWQIAFVYCRFKCFGRVIGFICTLNFAYEDFVILFIDKDAVCKIIKKYWHWFFLLYSP